MRVGNLLLSGGVAAAVALLARSASAGDILNHTALLNQHYGAGNTQWFAANIPIIETSDASIEQIYYYRWDVVNKHLHWLPDRQKWVMTEFYHPVWWEHPDRTISAAAGHHINESRWLRDRTYVNDYVDYWMQGGGNAYQYSFWAPDAVWQQYLASGDEDRVIVRLSSMKANYQGWVANRYDPNRQLFWQIPLQDATEFSVSDLQTGLTGGHAYRPTINAYMYASALAISRTAQLAGDAAAAQEFASRAAEIKSKMQSELWNTQQQQFMDRFTPHYPQLDYQFIDSRELAGMIPWYFGLPDDRADFGSAWDAVMDSATGFLGQFGLRTVEVTSPHYMNPAASEPGSELCTWNGPSWPYYTGMVLGGLANLINDYTLHSRDRADYVNLLRQYTLQHYKNGQPYVAEEYSPDEPRWLVDVANRSEHYFHSTYNDQIITGLAGLRPRADEIVEINPMIDSSIAYLCLEDVPYHSHEVTIVWDRDNHYGLGAGLHLLINGQQRAFSASVGRLTASLPTMGDANFDGIVDIADLGLVATHWQTASDWAGGDFNHDDFVDITDLGILATNWQSIAGLNAAVAALGLGDRAVPEPGFCLLMVLALPLLGSRPPVALSDVAIKRKRISRS